MILLGVAPCTAMVFVWSQLTEGDANYALVQVSMNDVIAIFAFAPLAAFLLGVTDIVVPEYVGAFRGVVRGDPRRCATRRALSARYPHGSTPC